MKPLFEGPISKEVQAKQRGQVGERPIGLGEVMKPFEQQQRDQGCPKLDAEGIFTGANEGLYGEILFQGFEEQFDLPAVLVDGGDGGGAECEQIGEQGDFALIGLVPNDSAAEQAGTFLFRARAGEANELVGEDAAIGRDLAFLTTSNRALSLRRVTK